MFDPSKFEQLARKLYTILPSSLQTVENEIQQEFKEILQAAFTEMDLLTREEFDIQVNVLARTREKVEILQQHLDQFLQNR